MTTPTSILHDTTHIVHTSPKLDTYTPKLDSYTCMFGPSRHFFFKCDMLFFEPNTTIFCLPNMTLHNLAHNISGSTHFLGRTRHKSFSQHSNTSNNILANNNVSSNFCYDWMRVIHLAKLSHFFSDTKLWFFQCYDYSRLDPTTGPWTYRFFFGNG